MAIAIIDDGVDADHEDLLDNLDMDHAYNFFYNNKDVEDMSGHGTGVSGCAAAKIDNNKGITGVAGNAIIMPLRIRNNQGETSWSVVNNAILYAADNGARIINTSFGNRTGNATTAEIIKSAWRKGCFLCGSAGNDGTNEPHYPAAYDNIMCVGASNMVDLRCSFSNYGPNVDIYAPGAGIYRTTKGGGYSPVSGTSIACPQIAGLAALIWSANPKWTNQEVWDKIIQSADTITVDIGEVLRMNSRKALDVEIVEGIAEEAVADAHFEITIPIGSQIVLNYSNCPQGFAASVFDAVGRKADEVHSAGASGTIIWGDGYGSGVYFIRPILSDPIATQKVILLD